MSAIREKVIHLLGHGVSQVVVAEAVNVSASYISQLLEEDGVREEVAKVRAGKIEEALEQDSDINSAEKEALKKVTKSIPYMKPMEALNAFKIFNAARRKSEESGIGAGAVAAADMVTITLPKAGRIFVEINNENQVTAVEGQTMATLPSRALPVLQRELEQKRLERKEATVVEALTPTPAAPPIAPPHVASFKERQQQNDKARAVYRLENLTAVGPNGQLLEI